MSQERKFTLITLIAGCSLALVPWLSLSASTPKIWAPLSIVLFIFGGWLALGIVPVVMWLWNPAAFAGGDNIPKRSIVLFLFLATLSIFYCFISWPYGIEYQGQFHTVVVILLNATLITALLLLGWLGWRRPSFRKSLAFHWLLFAWVISYAFPYLGELL